MGESEGEFTIERMADANGHEQAVESARNASGPDADQQSNAAPTLQAKSSRTDAYPDALRRKYYIVADERQKKGATRFYADDRGEYLAFKLINEQLTTRLTAPEIVRDMIAIAEHRKWTALLVRGSVEFRREAWLEASGRGMVVQGYEPTALDREALALRSEPQRRYDVRPTRRRSSDGKRFSADHANAVSPPATNATSISLTKRRFPRRETPSEDWRSRSARFRDADQEPAVRDEELVGAQSQIAIIEKALERVFPKDPQARERIIAVAKERIVEHLERGRNFPQAKPHEQMSSHHRERKRDDEARLRDEVREKTRHRER